MKANKQKSHTSGLQFFPVLRQTFLLGIHRKERAGGTQILSHPAFEDNDNLLLLKSGTKQANSASMLELETVRIGGLTPGSTKSRSIKQSSAPLCQTGLRHKCARTTATAELLMWEPEVWLRLHSYHRSKTVFPQCSDYYYPFTMPKWFFFQHNYIPLASYLTWIWKCWYYQNIRCHHWS